MPAASTIAPLVIASAIAAWTTAWTAAFDLLAHSLRRLRTLDRLRQGSQGSSAMAFDLHPKDLIHEHVLVGLDPIRCEAVQRVLAALPYPR